MGSWYEDMFTSGTGGSSFAGDFVKALLPVAATSVMGYYGGKQTAADSQADRDLRLQLEQMQESAAAKMQQDRLAQEAAVMAEKARIEQAIAQQTNLRSAYEAAMQGTNQSGQLNQNSLNSFINNVMRAYGR